MDRAQTLEAKQQAPELVLPGEDSLDGPEAVLENGWIEAQFAARFGALRPRGFSGMLGIVFRLKIALRLAHA